MDARPAAAELRLRPRRRSRPAPAWAGWTFALAAGLAVVSMLVYADVVANNRDIVIGTVVLGPLLCSIRGRPRHVAVVGSLAAASALLSGAWNENFTEPTSEPPHLSGLYRCRFREG